MRRVRSAAWAALLVGFGYVCGMAQVSERTVTAQEDQKDPAASRINAAYKSLVEARDTLEANGRYKTITDGVNSFLIMTGGGNAQEDLESGRGVDPETFAGLYAGHASPEIQPLLGVNEQGQITYNNEVVRMYSKSRLQRALADRLKYVDVAN